MRTDWRLSSKLRTGHFVVQVFAAESALAAVSHLSLLSHLSRRAGLAQFILIVFGCIYAGQDIQLLVNTPLIIHHSAYTTHHTPLVIHHSSYTTRHTPLIIHHSSYTPLVVAKIQPSTLL